MIISFILMTLMFDSGWLCKEKLDAILDNEFSGAKGKKQGTTQLEGPTFKYYFLCPTLETNQ